MCLCHVRMLVWFVNFLEQVDIFLLSNQSGGKKQPTALVCLFFFLEIPFYKLFYLGSGIASESTTELLLIQTFIAHSVLTWQLVNCHCKNVITEE